HVICFHQLLLPPTPPLFPYTTLFRSARPRVDLPLGRVREDRVRVREEEEPRPVAAARYPRHEVGALGNPRVELARHPVLLQVRRSEEHTSELQSPCNLVCRLLLDKKK